MGQLVKIKRNFILVTLVLIASLNLACSTTKSRLSFSTNDKKAKNYFIEKFRTSSIYQDYSRLLIMDAVYFDWELRKVFLDDYTTLYYADKDKIKQQQLQEYKDIYTFFIFVSFQKSRSALDKSNSNWKFFLKDWNEEEFQPVSVTKMKKDHLYQFFLERYFSQKLDSWTEVYLLNVVRNTAKNPKDSLILQISSLKGKALVEWKDPDIFFDDLKDENKL